MSEEGWYIDSGDYLAEPEAKNDGHIIHKSLLRGKNKKKRSCTHKYKSKLNARVYKAEYCQQHRQLRVQHKEKVLQVGGSTVRGWRSAVCGKYSILKTSAKQ